MTTDAIQLRITTDMGALPAAIEFNYQELKGALEQYLAKFDGLMVTEEDIRRATLDRAEINRVARTISRARIDTKKRYLEPFEVFEARAKELEGLCKEAEGKIAEQLESFEREREERKKNRLTEMWWAKVDAAFGETGREHFEAFFAAQTNPRTKGSWLNKGTTDSAIESAMDTEINRCATLRKLVESMYATADAEILAKARLEMERTFNMEETVKSVSAFMKEREAIAAAREAAEKQAMADAAARAEAAAAAHAAKMLAHAPEPAPAPAAPQEADEPDVMVAPVAPAKPPKIHTITMRLSGTAEQFRQLKEATDRIGIACERI